MSALPMHKWVLITTARIELKKLLEEPTKNIERYKLTVNVGLLGTTSMSSHVCTKRNSQSDTWI